MEVIKAENCKTTPDGVQAILGLSGGDMRRVLNLLQATSMAWETVDEKSVYLTSGAPLPQDMKIIMDLLLNQSFQKACQQITAICTEKGYALADVLQDLTKMVASLDLPSPALAMLMNGMSDVEHRLSFGTDEAIQTASLVGVYVQTRELSVLGGEVAAGQS